MTKNWKTVYLGVLFFALFMPNAAFALCGPIPSGWPILAGSKLTIEENVTVNNKTVAKNNFSGSYGINPSNGAVDSVSMTFPSLDPATFPSFSGSASLTSPSTVAAGTYNTVTINNSSRTPDAVFTGGDYYLNQLEIKASAAVQLAPGNYYINTLIMGNNTTLSISPTGTVRIYLNSSPVINNSISFNNGGSAANLQFYLYPNVYSFMMGDHVSFTGIVYAPDPNQKIEIGQSSAITGSLITAGEIMLKQSIALNYNATTQTQVSSVSTCQTGGGGGGSVNAANFNCVETGATLSTGRLYTKLAGTSFSFDVVALKADGSLETAYAAGANKNVAVELVDGSGNTACDSRNPVNPAVSQTLTFTAADSGRKATASITVNTTHTNLRCRVTDANQSPNIIGCSTDNFSIRPTGFSVTASINADAAGVSTSAVPIIKTGANFTLSAASGVMGYDHAPQLDDSRITAHAGASQTGTLTGSFASADATTGTAGGATFNYSETGYFKLDAYAVFDDSYTTVDSGSSDCTNDFSNLPVAGKYGCKFGNSTAAGYFGRFIPDHFMLTPGLSLSGCGSIFTYFGQDGFSTTFTLTAQNSANVTTQNYTGAYAKLDLTSWTNFVFTSTGLPTGSLLSASATAPAGAWNNGVAAITAMHQISRPAALTGPTTVIVDATPVDSDGVTMPAAPIAPGTLLRYGRISLGNAHGSELLDLTVPMQAEYYNGTDFIVNPDDICSVSTLTVVDPLPSDALQTADTCIRDDSAASGTANCPEAAPAGKSYQESGGLASGNFNLNLKAPGKTGSLDINATVADWLKFDWQGTGNRNPTARATFGIYKGNGKTLYWREVY